ncbi:hypothetical protein [Aquabacterium humicola]|uniref:hypothetical protein n=1 Tax=Aquabacterium humicola TaxID=3237377 RepID=UPI002543DBE9|nr:hypothetical protein [Rubrivivax pictus]
MKPSGLARAGWLALIGLLPGCVGLMVSSADYEQIDINLESKADVERSLGPPARREQQGGNETWFYSFQHAGLAGSPVRSTMSGVALGLPVGSRSRYDDNVRIEFEGEQLRSVHERYERTSTTGCGLVGHGGRVVCSSDADRRPHRVPADASALRVSLTELPAGCAPDAATAVGAACLARAFVLSRRTLQGDATVQVLDREHEHWVVAASPTAAQSIGYDEIRVSKRRGVVAARRLLDR